MFVSVIRYFDGYVRFNAVGAMPERLLNLATREGVTVWGMKRKDGKLSACVSARLYPLLLRFGRRAGVKIKLDKKFGLPFRVNKYRNRAGLLVGALLFVVTLYGMSFFLWNVEISGQVKLTDEQIRAHVYALNIKPGAYRGRMDPQALANRLMTELPELSWAAVNIIGSNAYVELREMETGAEQIPVDKPCNMKAERDGIILSMEATSGFAAVKVGEAVTQGNLLISGIWEDDQGNAMFMHATGKVIAQTERTERLEYPVKQELYIAAGDPVVRRRLDLFGLSLPISFTLPPDGDVSLEERETPVVMGKMHVPITVYEEKWTPLKRYVKALTEQEAERAAKERAQALRAQWAEEGVKILDVHCEKTMTGQSFVFLYTFACEENIAVKDEFIVN